MARYLVLICLWVCWCALHSLLISRPVTGFLERRFGAAFRFYRIVYNIAALVTLIPVLIYTYSLEGPELFHWAGPLRLVQALLGVAALILFATGARQYDFYRFLGLQQVRENDSCSALTDDCHLDTRGILALVRHPWYSGGILIVWARDLDWTAILTNLVITGYFVIGAVLEEKKLVAQFGETYIGYRKRVSMFFPFKWAAGKFSKNRRPGRRLSWEKDQPDSPAPSHRSEP
jgi:methanethiol S-methyltransferase